ncbi:MAG: hypothetical protein ACRDRA_06010 [Pseudonocardiaceae bacterium]
MGEMEVKEAAGPPGISWNSSTRVPRLRTVTVALTSPPGSTVSSAGSIVTRTPRFCGGLAGGVGARGICPGGGLADG